MPRPVLATHLKECKTISVLLTKTTEADLLKHFQTAFEKYEDHWRPYYDKLERIVQDQYDHNPYRKANWRKCSPDRKYAKGWEWNDWHVDDEASMERYYWMSAIRSDLRRCDSEFKWSEKEEHKWVGEFEYLIKKCLDSLRSNEEELARVDERNFASAKKEWQEYDAEWIDYQKRYKEHLCHRPRQWYVEEFARDKESQEWYIRRNGGDGIPNNEETCEFCIKAKKDRAEWEERQKREAEDRRVAEELERQEAEAYRQAKEEERKRQWAEATKIQYHCEDCDYHTRNKWNYDQHMDSKQHAHVVKQKSLYCKTCEIQCRTQMEYDHHVSTNKHKKATGEKKEATYRCDACDYTASLKHHYENHCKSKRHQENVRQASGEESVQVPTYTPSSD